MELLTTIDDVVVKVANEKHVSQVQELELKFWGQNKFPQEGQNGLAFTHYKELFELYLQGILVAVDGQDNVLGYVSFIKLKEEDIMKPMPFYDFIPMEVHNKKGDYFYIVNHTVDENAPKGVSRLLFDNLKAIVSAKGKKGIVVIWNWDHPYLREPANAEKFWGGHGFSPQISEKHELGDTRDPEWGPVIGVDEWTPLRATGGTLLLYKPGFLPRLDDYSKIKIMR